jgi:hypothetical protein
MEHPVALVSRKNLRTSSFRGHHSSSTATAEGRASLALRVLEAMCWHYRMG